MPSSTDTTKTGVQACPTADPGKLNLVLDEK